MAVEMAPGSDEMVAPGRLGDPNRTLATDPRADPRMVAALAPFGLDTLSPAPPVRPDSPRAEVLEYCASAETGFETLFATLYEGLPAVAGVERETLTVPGGGDNEITLYVHRPSSSTGPLPCLYHLHGGGMVLLEAAGAAYVRWRDELAAAGLVVVGAEFRNGAGKHGSFPFPAGLDDCVAGLRWVLDHRQDLGASSVVVSGESGGGNLSLATTLRAHREGWAGEIAGVYALCPYISNGWATKPSELPSLVENDCYFIGCEDMAVLAEVYDPGGAHADDPTCWPYAASTADLVGLPPHAISLNELDPLRDEGLIYYRRLLTAGVTARCRTVNGTCHAGDLIFRAAMPDVYAATIADLKTFVDTVA